jgi:hypothetical protein
MAKYYKKTHKHTALLLNSTNQYMNGCTVVKFEDNKVPSEVSGYFRAGILQEATEKEYNEWLESQVAKPKKVASKGRPLTKEQEAQETAKREAAVEEALNAYKEQQEKEKAVAATEEVKIEVKTPEQLAEQEVKQEVKEEVKAETQTPEELAKQEEQKGTAKTTTKGIKDKK